MGEGWFAIMADGAQTMLAARPNSATVLNPALYTGATPGGKLSRWWWRLGVAGASLAQLGVAADEEGALPVGLFGPDHVKVAG
jgi:hypothetical protein